MHNSLNGIAMRITPEQLEIYRKAPREREKAQRASLDVRMQRAWELARKTAPI